MKGIDRKKHLQLVDTIFQLEELLRKGPGESEFLEQATEFREQLALMYHNYELMLAEVSVHIELYEKLYNDIKVQFLGKKLKELKKGVPPQKKSFSLLQMNIQMVYHT